MTIPTAGAWGAVVGMVAYLDANLNTHVATVRTRYSETADTLPDVDTAVVQVLWLLAASTKVPVGVAWSGGGPQEPTPYALFEHRLDVSLLVNDAAVGGTGRAFIRAAAQYAEAVNLCLRAPEASTLGNATGVLYAQIDGAEAIPEPDGSPTIRLLVACTVRMQEA